MDGMPHSLPVDTEGVMRLAARSMFDLMADASQGMLVVDREHRIVWISDVYKRFLPDLGYADESEFVGRRVEDVVPATLMNQVIETGRPILVDLLTNRAGTFVVSRLPLRDDAGNVIGALGIVLLNDQQISMQPLAGKFARLQQELDAAHRALAEQRRPKHQIASFIGSSPKALEVKRQARRVAQAQSTVLLLGETGTGKDVLAHAIHAASPRAGQPLVSINIAAIPDTLLEAELFGVTAGAYTGADRRGREGKFAIADGGTLFLDEIGDMPLSLQSKLLRVLQEQEFEPLGSNKVRRVDVRVIAATSRDLTAMMARGEFRSDLYYRLNVLPIRVPALRERPEDVEALVDALGEDIARRTGLPVRTVDGDAIDLLARQRWPGNIRELRNVLEQAGMLTDELHLRVEHFAGLLPEGGTLPPAARAGSGPAAGPDLGATPAGERTALRPLPEQVADLERQVIADAMARTRGNKLAAARLLQISRATLYDKLAAYSL